MKSFLLLSIFTIILSCSSKSICNENKKFRKIYFEHINNVDIFYAPDSLKHNIESTEEYLNRRKEKKEKMIGALLFISNYSKISFEDTLNYTQRIPYSKYLNYKNDWIQWYNQNKCNNIELRLKR